MWLIVRAVETGLGRQTLVVAVISVDAYPFLALAFLPIFNSMNYGHIIKRCKPDNCIT